MLVDRFAWTAGLFRARALEAHHRGCADRLVPVVQGSRAEDYLRCDLGVGGAARDRRAVLEADQVVVPGWIANAAAGRMVG